MPPKLEGTGGWTKDSLAALLAPALGTEQSTEVVARAAARLGLTSVQLDDAAAFSIIDELSEGSGLIAVSARFARARIGHRSAALAQRMSSRPPVRAARPKASPPASAAGRRAWKLSEVAGLLATTLGKERGQEIVQAEVERMELREPFDTESVLRLLDQIAQSPGVVGTVAQFAKSRLVLLAK